MSTFSFRLLTIGTVGALVVIAYWPGLFGPLFFDDLPQLVVNSRLLSMNPLVLDEWRTAALSSDSGPLLRPVSMLTFAFNGLVPTEHFSLSLKLTNVVLHVINAVLVGYLASLLVRTPTLANTLSPGYEQRIAILFTAIVWALHPLHVSTVLYAVQRMAQLSHLFVILGLIFYLRFRIRLISCGVRSGDSLAVTLWLALFLTLAMLSKENGAVLVGLVLICELTLFNRETRPKTLQVVYTFSLAILALSATVIVLLLIWNPGYLNAGYVGREFTLEQRLLTQPRVLFHYITWITLPDISLMGFHHDDIEISDSLISPLTTLTSLVAWSLAILLSWKFKDSYPFLVFGVLFFLIGHSIESSFLPLEMVFEHRNYLPSVGIIFCLALFLAQLQRRTRRNLHWALLILCGLALFALTWTRSTTWSDGLILSRKNLLDHPESARAHFFYGQMLYERANSLSGDTHSEEEKKNLVIEARFHFERMHSLSPGDLSSLVMLHQIDAVYFRGYPDREVWLDKLKHLAASRPLQASDRAALDALVKFSVSQQGLESIDDVGEVVSILLNRYPGYVGLLRLQDRLAKARGESLEERLARYRGAIELGSDSIDLWFLLANLESRREPAQAYIDLGEGMKRDPLRRYLTSVKRVLSPEP